MRVRVRYQERSRDHETEMSLGIRSRAGARNQENGKISGLCSKVCMQQQNRDLPSCKDSLQVFPLGLEYCA